MEIKRTHATSSSGIAPLTGACPACGSTDIELLLEQFDVPAQSNVLFSDQDQAIACPKANIQVAIYLGCGFISNVAFDPAFIPDSGYEGSQAALARFREYAQCLAEGWIALHGLQGQTVIEIDCGTSEFIDRTIGALREQFREYTERGARVALWGAGSKATAYRFALSGRRDAVQCVVDINPGKRGMFIAGSGHPIVSPDDLAAYRPDVVIATNGIYADEIRRSLPERGIEAELTHA